MYYVIQENLFNEKTFKMKTFTFYEHNGNASLILSEDSYQDALIYLSQTVKYADNWRVDDEEGEDEEEALP